jgi:hypothetical protein
MTSPVASIVVISGSGRWQIPFSWLIDATQGHVWFGSRFSQLDVRLFYVCDRYFPVRSFVCLFVCLFLSFFTDVVVEVTLCGAEGKNWIIGLKHTCYIEYSLERKEEERKKEKSGREPQVELR